MIGVKKELIASIPCLIVCDLQWEKEALPMVIYFHGFTSAKETNLSFAYLLAEKGHRVVLPDSMYHGERGYNATQADKMTAFWKIIVQNLEDLKTLKDFYIHQGLILNGRLGVAGTSMGGITTTAALTQYEWVKTAAVLMGSPRLSSLGELLLNQYEDMLPSSITEDVRAQLFTELERFDLSKQIAKLNDRPLLFWHGEADSVVPFDHSYSFYQEARGTYHNPEDIYFIKEENRDHKVSLEAVHAAADWFDVHL